MDWKVTAAEIENLLPECEVRVRLAVIGKLAKFLPPKNVGVVEKRLEVMLNEVKASMIRCRKLRKRMPKVEYPEDLPISQRRDDLIKAIKENQVVVIAGETGSGKTTQLPKMCLDAGLGVCGKIACTQPRRIAALSVSQRVAEELKVTWGKEVGAKIRFTDKTGKDTRIKFLTDGMLLSEVHGDRLLSEYDTVIIDEAHERSLNIDFLLGYLNELRSKRPDLKIIITSATIDTETFSKAFDDAPIIEVSGRVYPVDVEYLPLDELLPQQRDVNYVEGAVAAVEMLIEEYSRGDILVFFPSEKDIRETRDALVGRRMKRVDVQALFGRLSAGDQQKVFASTQNRKVILATNIAETSLTIPGIRFVVDTGYVRLSRYSTATRTQRLPIEEISQSSANQRKGRCGRVENGVCIRLYSEDDFNKRPEYTLAEILRSNLAAVILRMVAFELGNIESFAFIDAPNPRAITAGYQLLVELGAMESDHTLTKLGKQLAHLPVDPTVGRMILEAKREGALDEVLIIAAGLSVRDPRERPEGKEAQADEMHKKFKNEDSDFLTLLNIWDAYHGDAEKLSQGQLRKFCKNHFISYMRIREWRDIHSQLVLVMKDLGEYKTQKGQVEYENIHRSILAGLLSNVALKDMGNHYLVARGRKAMIFPGSGLFDKKASKELRKKKTGNQVAEKLEGKTPEWIVASEVVDTGKVYARTVGGIDPAWLSKVGEHMIRNRYVDPVYDEKGERVVVKQRQIMLGLEIDVKRVGYVNVNPDEATEIFIREGLVGQKVRTHLGFIKHNLELLEKVEQWQARQRRNDIFGLEEKVYQYYAARIQNVGSVHDLKRLIKEEYGGDSKRLFMQESDLIETEELSVDASVFPKSVETSGGVLGIQYNYEPGSEKDGATLQIPMHEFEAFQPAAIDWLVPGYLQEKVDALLRALPKDVRRKLFPIADKAKEIMEVLTPGDYTLGEAMSVIITEKYGVTIPEAVWDYSAIPEYLKVRLEVVNDKQETIASARTVESIEVAVREKIKAAAVKHTSAKRGSEAWAKALKKWGKEDRSDWDFGDLPDKVQVSHLGGVPVFGYLGLSKRSERSVDVILFKSLAEADLATRAALPILLNEALKYEISWLQKDLKDLKKVAPLCINYLSLPVLQKHVFVCLCKHLYRTDKVLPLRKQEFSRIVERAKKEVKGLLFTFMDIFGEISKLKLGLEVSERGYPGMKDDLGRLFESGFLVKVPYSQLIEYPRYLKAMKLRKERYFNDSLKDGKKDVDLKKFKARYAEWTENEKLAAKCRGQLNTLRWMLEELQVSLFAQTLGTLKPISVGKVKEQVNVIQRVLVPNKKVETKKSKPVIDLGNLKIGRSF